MIKSQFQKHENVYWLKMVFAKAEDVLEMHQHGPKNYHDTVVINGSIEAYGPDKEWLYKANTGDFLYYTDDKQHHEIKALEDNTVILNLYRNPMPHVDDLLGQWL